MKKRLIIKGYVVTICCLLLLTGCGGVYHYHLQNVQEIGFPENKKMPGNVSLKVSAEKIYNHVLGFKTYKLYLREGIEKQYTDSLNNCFSKGLKKGSAENNVIVTAMDTSIFPIADIINDIRIFLKVEILTRT